jgi:hypothetical protein
VQGSPLWMLLAALASTGCGQASPVEDAGASDQEPEPSLASRRESAVTWDGYGGIDGRFGIMGGWYSYYDCDGQPWRPEWPAGLGCSKPDPDLVNWDMTPGWTTSAKKVCLKGTAARVEGGPGMAPQYDLQFGAGLGFNLNHDPWNPVVPCEQNSDCASNFCNNPDEPPDQEPAPGQCFNDPQPYDATKYGVKGFRFDITEGTPGTHAPATLAVRLRVSSVPVEAAHFIKIAVPALNQAVSWAQDSIAPSASEVEQGTWITDPTPFTPEAILSIEFEVYTNNQAPKPYDFCVSNFRVLQ